MGEMNAYRTKLELKEKEKTENEVSALRSENKLLNSKYQN